MRFRIVHHTQYTYTQAVSLSHNIVRLRPRDGSRQTCLQHELAITPMPQSEKGRRRLFWKPHRVLQS